MLPFGIFLGHCGTNSRLGGEGQQELLVGHGLDAQRGEVFRLVGHRVVREDRLGGDLCDHLLVLAGDKAPQILRRDVVRGTRAFDHAEAGQRLQKKPTRKSGSAFLAYKRRKD